MLRAAALLMSMPLMLIRLFFRDCRRYDAPALRRRHIFAIYCRRHDYVTPTPCRHAYAPLDADFHAEMPYAATFCRYITLR